MNNILSLTAVAAVAVTALLAAPQAGATTIFAGSSSSTFSWVTCPNATCSPGSITLASSTGTSSTLSIVNESFTESAAATNIVLAELTLSVGNKPDAGGPSFEYDIVLTFTVPGGSQSDTINLSLAGNTDSGSSADVTITGLTPSFSDPLSLGGGLSLSNFSFVNVGSAGSFSNGDWTVTGNGHSATLELLADLNVTGSTNDSPVPEPSSMALMGAALAGLGIARRKRKSS